MSRPAPEEQEYFRLRAEWLRFKNHVFDTNTELPTLAAVLDDVRRLTEERGTLGLIYLDLGGSGQVESLYGWHAYDGVVRAFAGVLAWLRVEGTLGARDIVAVLSVRSDKFLLFVGGPGTLPLDRATLEALVGRLKDRIAEALSSTRATPCCTAIPCCDPSARCTVPSTKPCS
jgi:hypothetical protein